MALSKRKRSFIRREKYKRKYKFLSRPGVFNYNPKMSLYLCLYLRPKLIRANKMDFVLFCAASFWIVVPQNANVA